jgi:hypothetical protein
MGEDNQPTEIITEKEIPPTPPKEGKEEVSSKEDLVRREADADKANEKAMKAKEEKEISIVEKSAENAKVTMKHFEDAVKKVREQKDLKIGQKVELSAFR